MVPPLHLFSSMTNRRFAGLIGIMYLCMGLIGALHEFHVDALHQALHFSVGLWGIMASARAGASVGFARKTTLLFGAVILLELSPMLRDIFGVPSMSGNGVLVVHVITALATAYYGYYWTDAVVEAKNHESKKAA
jgi:hypothetical protein